MFSASRMEADAGERRTGIGASQKCDFWLESGVKMSREWSRPIQESDAQQYVLPSDFQQILAARNLGGHFLAMSRDPMSPPQPAPIQSATHFRTPLDGSASSFKHLLMRIPSGDHREECEEDEQVDEDLAWSREETKALIGIRSEIDSFTDNPRLWEEISRKLESRGYSRSPRKCEEQFNRITHYYKLTKEGKGDVKSPRFFPELDELNKSEVHNECNNMENNNKSKNKRNEENNENDHNNNEDDVNSSSESSADYDDPHDSQKLRLRRHKRKSWKARMAFFETLVKNFIAKQEEMQQKFLELLEMREQERMRREETWRKHEVARLNREYELRVEEHARRINYDAALAAALHKATGQVLEIPHNGHAPSPYSNNIAESNEEQQLQNQVNKIDSTNKRWPRAEVQALIHLRAAMEQKFQEVGPKGPFWEEISAGLALQGYVRSAKRCKEKWENINKYYRKTSTKKRPENTKTCTYFQELDTLYQKGIIGGSCSTPKMGKFEETTDELDRDDSNEAEVLSIMPANTTGTVTGTFNGNAGNPVTTAAPGTTFSSPENCAHNMESSNAEGCRKRSWMEGLGFEGIHGGNTEKVLKFDGFVAKDMLELAQRHHRMQQQQQMGMMMQERQSQEFQEAESSATRSCGIVEGFGIGRR